MLTFPINRVLAFGLCTWAAASWSAGLAQAQTVQPDPVTVEGRVDTPQDRALEQLSLEELLEVEVTSVAKKEQSLLSAPAAVFVLTANDIRRSGAKSIPDALRMVPGLHVARVNASRWAISARGFDNLFANMLLVMIDGRVVYTPLFSGVFWDVQDTLLADVERIEVVRGPGGALWGSNAINGVINIITKDAADTKGGYALAGVGTEAGVFAAARQGFALGENGAARVFAKYFDRDGGAMANGGDATDTWDAMRLGFRADWQIDASNEFTLIGDAYSGNTSNEGTLPVPSTPYMHQRAVYGDTEGGSVLGRYKRHWRDGGESLIQAFWDYAAREVEPLDSEMHTADLELQHAFEPWGSHSLMVGAGFRWVGSDYESNFITRTRSPNRDLRVYNAFFHDQFDLIDDELIVTIGAKLEHNDFSHFEFQPDARLIWHLDKAQSLWGAASRASGIPSTAFTDGIITATSAPGPGGLPLTTALVGTESLNAEKVTAYELGYRFRSENEFYCDATAFYARYDGVMSYVPGAPITELSPIPRITVPLTVVNGVDAYSYGAELATSWQPIERLRLSGAYTFLRLETDYDTGTIPVLPAHDKSAPRHAAHLRAAWNPIEDLQLDASIAYNGRRSSYGVPSYWRLDLRAGWQPFENTEIEIVGQNLLEDEHPEFGNSLWYGASEVERAAYLQVTHRF